MKYRLAVAAAAAERIRHLPPDVKRAIKEAIRAIAGDPRCGTPLLRELEGCMKYRVRRYRIVYRVDRAARTVAVLAVGHRRTIYDEAVGQVHAQSPRGQ
ncbi:MAG: type II toxin-antitoxin system RelE family toxin [Terriglobales bacterium]